LLQSTDPGPSERFVSAGCMTRKAVVGVAVAAMAMSLGAPAWAQSGRKLSQKHQEAYDKAIEYLLKEMGKMPFAAKAIFGFALLADGTRDDELAKIVQEAKDWEKQLKFVSQHGTIWYPALAALFLTEYYKFRPDEEVKSALEGLVKYFGENQESTGGWFKWKGGGLNGKYPAPDLTMLTATIYSSLLTARKLGVKVPDTMIQNADRCLQGILMGNGLGYGTGNRSPDKTGGRVGLAMLGLDYTGQKSHKIFTTAATAVPEAIPRLDQGHHWGGLHCAAVTLSCHRLGGGASAKLANAWLDKLIAKQKDTGGIYVGDDGDAGGEVGLLGGDHSSTAAVMLMILLQDPDRLDPKKRAGAGDAPGGGGRPSGGGSPFSKPKDK
jgi:hypothetical protein